MLYKNAFKIPVEFQGKELAFDAEYLHKGYINQIQVDVFGMIVLIEKDDEGNLRALLADIKDESSIDKDLVKEIVQTCKRYCNLPE